MSMDTGRNQLRPLIAPLAESDLAQAQRIVRLAFGTFLGAPDPETFWTDRDYAHGRGRAPHVSALGARLNGELVGSNFVTRWGSVGFFGPLSVRPDLQEHGIAQALLAATVDQFKAWGTTHSGLFTFAQSAKHVGLYQKFGFYPRFLTAIMLAPVRTPGPVPGTTLFSTLTEPAKACALHASRELTETLYPGLDLAAEIETVAAQGLGDTVLLEGARGLAGFAICHHGPRSEAGEGCCFIKFAAVRPSPSAEEDFARLLDAVDALAISAGMPNVLAGTNLARQEAYRHLLARGFRTLMQGVNMHSNNEPGTCRPGLHIIDDWR